MIPSGKKVIKNNVINRFLPIQKSVLKGLEPEPKISDFHILKDLGSGSFGRVLLAQHKITQAKYAIKTIDKRNQSNIKAQSYFKREIEIMYKVHHPNVVKLFGHFEDNNYCYFIMEYIEAGNLFSFVPKNSKKLSLKQIASIMKDVISAVYYLHHMQPKIIHRDIKPENILLDKGMVAKLTDFGWSNYYNQGEYKRATLCGTFAYLAPEIINKSGHDEHVDIWCIGVLLYELLTGETPFKGYDMDTLRKNINRLKIKWSKDLGKDASDLIYKILKYTPEERLTLRQIINHPFFTKFFPNSTSCLIRPDLNARYRTYLISKDSPDNWNPILYGEEYSQKVKPSAYSGNKYTTLNEYNYNNIITDKFYSSKKVNDYGNYGFSNNYFEKGVKKNRQLTKTASEAKFKNFKFYSEQKNTFTNLLTDNYGLKTNLFETHFKNNNKNDVVYLGKDLNRLNNSTAYNNFDGLNLAFNNFKPNIENYNINNGNPYMLINNNDMKKWEQDERKRKEKQQLNDIINNYGQL